MNCPKCGKELKKLQVISECHQPAIFERGIVHRIGAREESEVTGILCDGCLEDVWDFLEKNKIKLAD